MYRAAIRSSPRALRAIRQTNLSTPSRRLASTAAPADRPRTWKGSAARWGVAIAAVYWYNTSPIFADEAPPGVVPAPEHFSSEDTPTIEAVLEQKRRQADSKALRAAAPSSSPATTISTKDNAASDVTAQSQPQQSPQEVGAASATSAATAVAEDGGVSEAAEALEEEADQQGAFNPETGEINWDCPCLGGMAHGPCGDEFKAAFSCFVYSKEEPKGMDCIDKFQGMQDCFRKYPEIYGAELEDDEEDAPEREAAATAGALEADASARSAEKTTDLPSSSSAQPKSPAQTPVPASEKSGSSDQADTKPTSAESKAVDATGAADEGK